MIMSAQPIFDAVKKIKGRRKTCVILTAPSGTPLDQKRVEKLSTIKNIIIICGHYEGVDDRVRKKITDECISIGDYVLTGGEIPAAVIVDAITRLVPGVLGKAKSLENETFEKNLLEHPQFTRPANFRGINIPNVLLSGDHKAIKVWRNEESVKLTKKIRPELL